MITINQATAAALAGLTGRRLQQMVHESDPPPRDATGGYPAREYGDWLKSRALAGVSIADDGTVYVYEVERARLVHEQADKTALENAALRADLVRMSVVEEYWAALGAILRSKLTAIPSQIGALIPDPQQRAKLAGQVERLIFEAMAEIQKDAVPSQIREQAERAAKDSCP